MRNAIHRSFVAVFAASLLAACAQMPQQKPAAADPAAVTTPVSAGRAANDNLNAVAWTQLSVERAMLYRQAYRGAHDQLLRALQDPSWDALAKEDRQQALTGLKPAIILDIDETVLDNSPYQARLVRNNETFDDLTWARWCREAKARALPGAVEFTQFAASKGVTVFYLSNRTADLNDVTLANLRSAGFPIKEGENVFLGQGTAVPGCKQHGSEKGCRRQLIAPKYRVLMQFGDQIGDFVDISTNTLQGRDAAVEPYLDWIGERWFVLPNPTYGSWESALFNNAWSQPAEVRRQAKLDALLVD